MEQAARSLPHPGQSGAPASLDNPFYLESVDVIIQILNLTICKYAQKSLNDLCNNAKHNTRLKF